MIEVALSVEINVRSEINDAHYFPYPISCHTVALHLHFYLCQLPKLNVKTFFILLFIMSCQSLTPHRKSIISYCAFGRIIDITSVISCLFSGLAKYVHVCPISPSFLAI